jgi:DNA-binding NarL/FixJ family response regulator
MLTIAIIEDQPAIREAYAAYLTAQPEFRVVVVCASVEDFLVRLPDLPEAPKVVLSDIGLPGGMSGIEGVKVIRQQLPQTEVLLISVYNDAARVFQALCAGAVGYLVKNTPLVLLKENLLQVAAGGSPMSPSVARHVVQYFRPVQDAAKALSTRELQIVQGIEDGLSYKLIADRLGIAMDTVRSHIRTVYRKLEVNSKSEIIARMARQPNSY